MITEVNSHTGDIQIFNETQFQQRLRDFLPKSKQQRTLISSLAHQGKFPEHNLKHQWFRPTKPEDYERMKGR